MTEPARAHAAMPRRSDAALHAPAPRPPEPKHAGRPSRRPSTSATSASTARPAGVLTPELGARVAVILTSLAAARRELERATHELDRRVGADAVTTDAATAIVALADSALIATQHLVEASRAYAGVGEDLNTTTLHADMDAMSQALLALSGRIGSRASMGAEASLAGLVAVEQRLRHHLGLRPVPATATKTPTAKTSTTGPAGDTFREDRRAIGPALDLARIEAEATYARLVQRSDERNQLLPSASRSIAQHLEYVRWLLARDPDPGHVTSYTTKIAAVSPPILRIRAWLFPREANADLMAGFDQVLRAVDGLRAAVGLGAITSMDTPVLPQSETEEVKNEASALTASKGLFGNAVDTRFKGFEQGADKFKELAALVRPKLSSFWEGIAGEILIMMLGNLVAPGIGVFARMLASRVARMATGSMASPGAKGLLATGVASAATSERWQRVMDYAAGAAVDSTQAGLQRALVDAKAFSPNQVVRERQYFYNGLVLAQARLVQHTKDRVETLIDQRQVSAAELQGLTDALNAVDVESFATSVFQQAAQGYALLQARKGLGGDSAEPSSSRMDDYFERDVRGRPKQLGTTGVARLSLEISQPADELRVRVRGFEVHGMNDDLTIAILAHADHRLVALALPLEIAFIPPRWGRRFGMSETIVAVDERGSVRSTLGWEGIEEMMRSSGEWRTRPTNAVLLDSPQALYDALREVVLPSRAARITEGG